MKTTSFLTILFLFNLFSVTNFAQGEAAVPFLLLNPSPSLSAMGSTGAALPTEDPFGFLWNPAQLGYTSQTNNLSFIFYPSKVDWAPAFNVDLELNAIALNVGYNFKDLIGFPLSFGFGYSNTNLSYGTFVITDPEVLISRHIRTRRLLQCLFIRVRNRLFCSIEHWIYN